MNGAACGLRRFFCARRPISRQAAFPLKFALRRSFPADGEMSVAQNLETHPVLDGKYALRREIGAGTTGTVYEAEHLVVGKFVAIKLMKREAFANPEHRDQFVTEARAAARIAHANVVDIHDLGVTPDGVPYLVMELLRGETLEQHRRRARRATAAVRVRAHVAGAWPRCPPRTHRAFCTAT